MPADERIDRLDITLFDHAVSQMRPEDKGTLLSLQSATRAAGPYTYLEIGSYLGGSLQPFLVDPLCERIISIDARHAVPPDSRPGMETLVQYPDNSTARMLELLEAVPGADLSKLTTIDASTEAIDPASIVAKPSLCFIDGEHTSRAALRDAMFCTHLAPDATIAFHDRGSVREALAAFLNVYGGFGYQMPRVFFVVERDPVLWRRSSTIRNRADRPRLWEAMNRARLAGPFMTGLSLLKRS